MVNAFTTAEMKAEPHPIPAKQGRSASTPMARFMLPPWESVLLPALLCVCKVSPGAYMCKKMQHFHLNVQKDGHFHHSHSLLIALWLPSLQLSFY